MNTNGALLGAVVSALALTGCGSATHVSAKVSANTSATTTSSTTGAANPHRFVSSFGVQGIVLQYAESVGEDPLTVTCPNQIPVQKGLVTTCAAEYNSGEIVHFLFTQTDNRAHGNVRAGEMISPDIEAAIVHEFPVSAHAQATCPQHEPIVVGQSFDCIAHAQGRTVTFRVKVRNPYGGWLIRRG